MPVPELKKLQCHERDILERHIATQPVKLGPLAEDFNLLITVSSLGLGVSGQIKRENGEYVIRVNRHEIRERQRFTIAHEISHYLLHRSIIDSTLEGIRDNVLYRSGEPEWIEYEANRLAAHILMPKYLVQKILNRDYGGNVSCEATVEGLAKWFKVSKAAMEINLSTFSAGV